MRSSLTSALLTSALLFAPLVLAGLGGCREKVEERAPAPPVDHLAPGESVEGKEKAFGLPLPRLATVTARFQTTVVVSSALSREELSGFVRARILNGTVTDTDASTRLLEVAPKAEPARRLDIEVRNAPPVGTVRSEMVVRDVTGLPVEPGLSDAERWRRAGFGPNGGVLDPTKLE